MVPLPAGSRPLVKQEQLLNIWCVTIARIRMVYEVFRSMWIWRYVGDRLSWYYRVSINEAPAKYLIAKRVSVPYDPGDDVGSIDEALGVYEKYTQEFLRLKRDVENGEDLSKLDKPRYSLVDLARDLVYLMLRQCRFCRWRCRVDRVGGGKLGTCMLTEETRVSSYFHHPGEELVFRGTHGSGTIFFTSCNMRCLFCQNSDISKDRFNGIPVAPRELAQMAYLLRIEGCHNINWVGGEPTIHLHSIVAAIWHLANEGFRLKPRSEELDKLVAAKSDYFGYEMNRRYADYKGEFNAPMLFNSNMFMTKEALTILRPLIDVWLPDFKFGPGRCAIRLSRTPWYYETVTENLKTIYDWGEDMLIRHLIMPNHVDCCTKPVLDWVARNVKDAPINIMDQYRPEAYADPTSPDFNPNAKDIARRPHTKELVESWRYAEKLGLLYREVTFEKKGYRPVAERLLA